MNRFTLKCALATALLAPAGSYAQVSCTADGLKAAADLYVALQSHDFQAPERPPLVVGRAPQPIFWGVLPISGRLGYVENFDVLGRGRLIDKPLNIDQHRSLLDTERCETFTEGLVS